MSDESVVTQVAELRRELEALKAERAKGRRWRVGIVLGLLAAGVALAQPAMISFSGDNPALATEVNANFTNLRNYVVPVGGIILWEGATCPTGFNEYTGARGRVVVGSPLNVTANTQLGMALTGGEDRTITHAHNGTTNNFLAYGPGEVNYVVQQGFGSPWMIRQTLTTDAASFKGSEVFPSVYLRYCRKN